MFGDSDDDSSMLSSDEEEEDEEEEEELDENGNKKTTILDQVAHACEGGVLCVGVCACLLQQRREALILPMLECACMRSVA